MRIYDSVAGNHPPKNLFDLSHSHFLTMKVGMLYPLMCEEVYPGDVLQISDAVHCELQPMVAPLMTDLDLYSHTFFVPFRLIYGVDTSDGKSLFEKFITGGEDGDYSTPLPSWTPTWSKTGFTSDTIWDAVGFAVSYTAPSGSAQFGTWKPLVPKDLAVSKAPKLSYNFIYNTYYRDENLQDEVDLENENLLYANWRKDYFTSSLESQQFGTAPAIPISGIVPVRSSFPASYSGSLDSSAHANFMWYGNTAPDSYSRIGYAPISVPQDSVRPSIEVNGGSAVGSQDGFKAFAIPDITGFASVDLSGATTFNVSDLRLAFAIQRLMELSMTGGHRYTEYLQAHFGASPTDARLDRPEYIGGCKFPVSVSATVQTSETSSSPQGNKAGVGSINDIMQVGTYRVQEFGLIMTLGSIRPKPCYHQGIPRNWLRQTRFDYYHPEFANLSEQAVYRAEIYVDPSDSTYPDNGIFGYQAHWNELRARQNFVTGAMREQFDYWTMSRKFGSRPALNADFISLNHPEEYNRIWAVQDEDQFIVAWSNIVRAYRPIPAIGTPGLIDHVYGGR